MLQVLQKIINTCADQGMRAPYTVTTVDAAGQRVTRHVGHDFDRLVVRHPAEPAPPQLPVTVTVEDAAGENRVFDVLSAPEAGTTGGASEGVH